MPDSSPHPDGARASARPAPGGPDALCRLWFLRYGEALYGYLRLQVGSADEAEDLTAEVFLHAVRAAGRFDPDRAAWPWLFRIARNVVRDHARRERRRRQVPLDAMRDLRCDDPSPEERLLRREDAGRLLAALARLSAKDREIVALRYGTGLTTEEVAAALGIREAAARTRLWRALRRLRAVIRP